jgi:hypothetical protein
VSEVSQDRLEERDKFGTGFLFECSESTTTGFLHLFVGIENSLKKLILATLCLLLPLTPSIVGMKCCCWSAAEDTTQLEYRPRVQHVMDLTSAFLCFKVSMSQVTSCGRCGMRESMQPVVSK